jgi:hypothetical protein
MSAGVHGNCRKAPCTNSIPPVLSKEHLCLQHFLDESFARTEEISRACEGAGTIRSADIEWLLEDALIVVTSLEADANTENSGDRERMLELLLSLANLHEYVAHHSLSLDRSAKLS